MTSATAMLVQWLNPNLLPLREAQNETLRAHGILVTQKEHAILLCPNKMGSVHRKINPPTVTIEGYEYGIGTVDVSADPRIWVETTDPHDL